MDKIESENNLPSIPLGKEVGAFLKAINPPEGRLDIPFSARQDGEVASLAFAGWLMKVKRLSGSEPVFHAVAVKIGG